MKCNKEVLFQTLTQQAWQPSKDLVGAAILIKEIISLVSHVVLHSPTLHLFFPP